MNAATRFITEYLICYIEHWPKVVCWKLECGRITEWINKRTNKGTNEQTNERSTEPTNEPMNERTNQSTNQRTSAWSKPNGQAHWCIVFAIGIGRLCLVGSALTVRWGWRQPFHFSWSENLACPRSSNHCDFCCFSQRSLRIVRSPCSHRWVVQVKWVYPMPVYVDCLCLALRGSFLTWAPVQSLNTANQRRV